MLKLRSVLIVIVSLLIGIVSSWPSEDDKIMLKTVEGLIALESVKEVVIDELEELRADLTQREEALRMANKIRRADRMGESISGQNQQRAPEDITVRNAGQGSTLEVNPYGVLRIPSSGPVRNFDDLLDTMPNPEIALMQFFAESVPPINETFEGFRSFLGERWDNETKEAILSRIPTNITLLRNFRLPKLSLLSEEEFEEAQKFQREVMGDGLLKNAKKAFVEWLQDGDRKMPLQQLSARASEGALLNSILGLNQLQLINPTGGLFNHCFSIIRRLLGVLGGGNLSGSDGGLVLEDVPFLEDYDSNAALPIINHLEKKLVQGVERSLYKGWKDLALYLLKNHHHHPGDDDEDIESGKEHSHSKMKILGDYLTEEVAPNFIESQIRTDSSKDGSKVSGLETASAPDVSVPAAADDGLFEGGRFNEKRRMLQGPFAAYEPLLQRQVSRTASSGLSALQNFANELRRTDTPDAMPPASSGKAAEGKGAAAGGKGAAEGKGAAAGGKGAAAGESGRNNVLQSYLPGRSGEPAISRNPLLLGLPFPNIAYDQFERVWESAGNATNSALASVQRAGARVIAPIEDARTVSLTARDRFLANRLQARNATMEPLRRSVTELGDRVTEVKSEFDQIINSTLLRPVNVTASRIGQIQTRLIDRVGHRSILKACLMNPWCCEHPSECSP